MHGERAFFPRHPCSPQASVHMARSARSPLLPHGVQWRHAEWSRQRDGVMPSPLELCSPLPEPACDDQQSRLGMLTISSLGRVCCRKSIKAWSRRAGAEIEGRVWAEQARQRACTMTGQTAAWRNQHAIARLHLSSSSFGISISEKDSSLSHSTVSAAALQADFLAIHCLAFVRHKSKTTGLSPMLRQGEQKH